MPVNSLLLNYRPPITSGSVLVGVDAIENAGDWWETGSEVEQATIAGPTVRTTSVLFIFITMDMNVPIQIPATFEPSLPLDASVLEEPLQLEGSVQRFDPIARAASLATSMPREWCGRAGDIAQTFKLAQTPIPRPGSPLRLRGCR